MSFFRFKVIEPTGKILTGIIKLPYDNPSSVITYLEQDNNVAISVKKLNFFSTLFMDCATASIGTKVSRPLVAEFLSNLSLMIKGGITLMASLQESAGETSNPAFREIIEDMVQGMGGGRTFSDMVEKYKNIFPKTVIHLIRIGEETGKLDQMLRDASEHLKRIHTIIDDTKQALLYPAFVFLTMGAAFFFWFYYVVPKILTLFKEMNVELPTLTVLLLKVSAFVQYNFWSLIGILILTPFILITGYKNSSFLRKVFDVIFLKLPVVGNIIKASILAFISEYLSILLKAGINIVQALQILTESIRNQIYRERLTLVHEGVSRGDGIGESFKAILIFPNFVTRMISIGEQSGSLTEQLDYIAEESRQKLSAIVASIGKMIEPIVLIFAGTMFAIIIVGLFLPVYDLITQLAQR